MNDTLHHRRQEPTTLVRPLPPQLRFQKIKHVVHLGHTAVAEPYVELDGTAAIISEAPGDRLSWWQADFSEVVLQTGPGVRPPMAIQ